MIRTLIRQGEENCKNHNIIKQYKEENHMLEVIEIMIMIIEEIIYNI